MDKLAPEILAMIVSHLQPPLAPFAVVSRKWQHAIEAHTFSRLELTSEEDELQRFKSTLASPRRRRLVRSLVFHIELVVPSEKRVWKLESKQEAAANNTIYTRAVVALFSILAAWEHNPALSLWISANSSVDGCEPLGHEPKHCHNGEPMWRIRGLFKYINFDAETLRDLGGLPSVSAVAHFEHNNYRQVDPAVFSVFCAALPGVEKMDWWFIAPPRRLPDLRRNFRSSAADSLLETAALAGNLTQLTTLNIRWEDHDPRNHQFDPGNFLDPGSTSDRFSVAIRHISRLPSLRHLKLQCCFVVSKEVFEGTDPNNNGEELWRSLQTFGLELSHTTPDGGWHFIGDPENALDIDERLSEYSGEEPAEFDSADSDTSDWAPHLTWERENGMLPSFEYRCIPNPATFVPLLLSMAAAVRRMPALRELELGTASWSSAVQMRFNYYAPGYPKRFAWNTEEGAFHLAHAQESRWVIWRRSMVEEDSGLESNWRVPKNLRNALHETASEECILILQ